MNRKLMNVFYCFIIIMFSVINEEPVHAVEKLSSYIIELERDQPLEKFEQKLTDTKITDRYEYAFYGFAVEVDKFEIDRIAQIKGVKAVYPSVSYKVALDESVRFIGADQIRRKLSKDKSLTGKGVKVGVIDTGIDYNHRDLKDSYYGGYDLVDQDDDPMETTLEQGEPTQHGTHVAGIIAANGKLKGVAPKAEIYAYRAIGPGGTGTSEQVIAAIERAVKDGMDIINLSLGNDVNGPDWPTSIALNGAAEQGVVAVTSNGNSGPGMWTVGSPGTASKAISVGASTPSMTVPYIRLNREELTPVQLLTGSPKWDINKSYEVIDAKKGTTEDLQGSTGKLVLIERGDTSFTEKAQNAQKAGARAVFIYNNEEGSYNGLLEAGISIPVAALGKETGEQLKAEIIQGHVYLETVRKEIDDQLALFSSRGPVTVEWGIKPDLTAPGVAIKSTVPDGYTPLDGTSMASPHVAGAAALILQLHPDWEPNQVKAALMNTAKKLTNDEGETYKVYEQGAGRIQLQEAVIADTLIYPSSLTFGFWNKRLERQQRGIQLKVENHSAVDKKVTFNPPSYKAGIQWKLPSSFTLRPFEKKDVTVTLDVQPQFMNQGIHDGWLNVNVGRESTAIPYLYLVDELSYPKVMGFDFSWDEHEDGYKYELYLSKGADEVFIFLIEPNTMKLTPLKADKLSYSKGRQAGVFTREELNVGDGVYYAVASIEIDGETYLNETIVEIGKFGESKQHISEDLVEY
ncbi:S8 family serine peptidase [Bacillus solimangrovi]|uniref:Peptidase S8 n=1 Tax=Bacillus solimangrovi TaxID=1305675 RepID=A0A1E5LGV2_9BACI|nr:S8 family serine peptidase [Bacillus solimangrovi]OEH93309.1 hypothetical protein BFG57_12345 [Bacillus solimangrovi]